MVGYQDGYGEIDDYYPQSTSGSFKHLRVLAMVSVKNGTAVTAVAIGPYQEFTEDLVGHASGANLLAAGEIASFVNSFSWAGDLPR
jgi:hypothetical protein